ncbi:hypothetical protein LCGC14_0223020 [marine sediment metagenome]|uniref:Uncharacterized protein n=1 Tax=marine sediment metagenome TaxID=412755 RepID=A0A0F9UGB4_9ZZZZ|nr:hypothetical protein [bacterium]
MSEEEKEKKWREGQVDLYENLQKRYEGNPLFEALEDAQLAIGSIMETLERGEYEIVKKKK